MPKIVYNHPCGARETVVTQFGKFIPGEPRNVHPRVFARLQHAPGFSVVEATEPPAAAPVDDVEDVESENVLETMPGPPDLDKHTEEDDPEATPSPDDSDPPGPAPVDPEPDEAPDEGASIISEEETP